MNGPSLAEVREAIADAVPLGVAVWPAPYDRRFGELDERDRLLIVQNAAARVMALFGDGQVQP